MMVKLQLATASMHIAAGCFVASAAKYGRVSFVHQQVKPRSFGRRRHPLILNRVGAPVPVPALLHAANGEPIDPLSALYDDDILPLPSTSSSWGVADDWSNLSSPSSAAASTTFASTSSSPLPSMNGNYDAMEEAARILEEHDQILSEWDGSEDNDENNASTRDSTYVKSSNNSDFVEDAIEMIASNSDYYETDGVQLYDTASSTSSPSVTTVTKAEANGSKKEEDEIAFMIRCNQSPEQFLISQGRALPELTDDIKYSTNFLLEERQTSGSAEAIVLPLQPKATAFLNDSVKKIFDTYSVQVKEEEGVSMEVLDREAVSKWMTTCITSPITSFETVRDTKSKPWRDITAKSFTMGPYDRHISAVLSRYSQNHGSGYLTLEEFQVLYLEVAWAGYIKDVKEKKLVLDQNGVATRVHIPSSEESAIIKGKKNTEKMLKEASLSLIWRDLEAHGIFSPAEEERVQQLLELEKLQASLTTTSMGGKNSQPLMDECVLFDDYADRLSHQSYSDENDSDMLGVEQAWDFLKERKEKSSYKLVEMAYDGKTPKRIRDGEHVFIDEESCIGCTQVCCLSYYTLQYVVTCYAIV